MSLPLKAIDRLFERLGATYGSEWTARWMGQDEMKVKTLWSHELGGFSKKLESVAWALENLPERAPNVIEFRNLCRKAPQLETPRLPEPKADPERLKTELAKLRGPAVEAATRANYDHKAWAHRLIAKAASGINVPTACLRMAKEAVASKAVA